MEEEEEINELEIQEHQENALELLYSKRFCLLYGGGRSGKTFIIIYYLLYLANLYDPERKGDKNYELKSPMRILVVRHHLSDLIKSIIKETLPIVADLMDIPYSYNGQDKYLTLENGSEIWFGGLDEGRGGLDRILGKEYTVEYFNEVSQISFGAYVIALSRLAQETGFRTRHMYDEALPDNMKRACGWIGYDENGNPIFDGVISEIGTRVILDENPPSKAHWTYKMFIEGINPEKKTLIPNFEKYGHAQLNPNQNNKIRREEYIETMQNMSDREAKRFIDGEFSDVVIGALFTDDNLNQHRVVGRAPELKRTVISIDPATTANMTSDETGLTVVGETMDGLGVLLEDKSDKYSPTEWVKSACELYYRWDAECIVVEVNQGGDMVKHAINEHDQTIPVREVHATKGKILRAEPISYLYSVGKIFHYGSFPKAEEEMTTYTGKPGELSPNRLDSIVHGFTYLFPSGRTQSDLFSNDKLLKFTASDEILGKDEWNIFIKIGDHDNYHFGLMSLCKKNGRNYVSDILFNNELPIELLPEVAYIINKRTPKAVIVECHESYSEFTFKLREYCPKANVMGATLPSDSQNRILIESQYIKDNFAFIDDPEDAQYKLFMKQLNYYNSLSLKEDSHAADLCACASDMMRILG